MPVGDKAGLELGKPMRDVFGDAILAVCEANPRVVVLDGDLGNSTKTEYVRQKFPERWCWRRPGCLQFNPLDHQFFLVLVVQCL
jgi:hypothetical protein